jgi:hypothetical protein
MRAVMYVLSIAAQDEDTQRKGCVGILINVDPFRRSVEPADNLKLCNFMANLGPVRYVACHFCVSQESRISNALTLSILQATPRWCTGTRCVRFRLHSGTSTRELDLGLT